MMCRTINVSFADSYGEATHVKCLACPLIDQISNFFMLFDLLLQSNLVLVALVWVPPLPYTLQLVALTGNMEVASYTLSI